MKPKSKLLKYLALALASDTERARILDLDQPLSKCSVWKMLEQVYREADMEVWKTIPFYITSNPFVAETYADLIVYFLLDYKDSLDHNEPVDIIELGAGSGYLSFNVLKELTRKLASCPPLQHIKLRYTMTDLTAKGVEVWLQNERFAEFHRQGVLDFAVFKPEQSQGFTTKNKVKISNQSIKNPAIFFANYFFDSLRHDAFRVVNHQLEEALHSFSYSQESGITKDNAASPHFAAMEKQESYVPLPATKARYPQTSIESVLRSYERDFENATVLFPTHAFICLENLRALSNNRFILISTDKGFSNPDEMEGLWEQQFYCDPGIFSYQVNYDALSRYTKTIGGIALNTDIGFLVETHLSMLIPDKSAEDFPLTRYYFDNVVCKKNPINYQYYAQHILHEIDNSCTREDLLKACISFVSLSNFDPMAFYRCSKILTDHLEEAGPKLQRHILRVVREVASNCYPLETKHNVWYPVGELLYRLGSSEQAIAALHQSIRLYGINGKTAMCVALCYEDLGNPAEAQKYQKLAHQYKQ